MKLTLLVLRTNRLEDLKEFYSAVGARFISERHGSGPAHYAARLGDLVFEIYPSIDGAPTDLGLRTGFEVDDLPATLRSIGQTVAPRQTPWGRRAVVHDPDGRAVELYQA